MLYIYFEGKNSKNRPINEYLLFQVCPSNSQFEKTPGREHPTPELHPGRRHNIPHASPGPAPRRPRGHDRLLSHQGLGGSGGDGGKPPRKQVDPREVRLSGELQRRIHQRHTKDGRLRAAADPSGHHRPDAAGGQRRILHSTPSDPSTRQFTGFARLGRAGRLPRSGAGFRDTRFAFTASVLIGFRF